MALHMGHGYASSMLLRRSVPSLLSLAWFGWTLSMSPGCTPDAPHPTSTTHAPTPTGAPYALVEQVTEPPGPKTRDPLGRMPYRLVLPTHISPPPMPANNPLTEEGVALGRMLFYDPILSGNNQQSCSSCHQQKLAFTDGKKLAIGSDGRPAKRNTMSLVNLAWAPSLMWDGRAPSLEAQALIPITDKSEMNQDLDELVDEIKQHARYPDLFAKAFPEDEISMDLVTKALAQFVRTLISFDAPIDHLSALQQPQVNLSAQEERGSSLLTGRLPKGDPEGVLDMCNDCHDDYLGLRPAFHTPDHDYRGLFTGTEPTSNGLAVSENDPGRSAVTGQAGDIGHFNIPTVRNIGVTGPYMHDGRFDTLREVLEHYNEHMENVLTLDPRLRSNGTPLRLNLTDEDIDDIIALLLLLTDNGFLTNPSFSDPFVQEAAASGLH